ncbi:MAG TPA: DNA topoisomerase III, partial [Shewanella baltica]|nr:DNA topoisomerase III [Shewanella baltica]
KRGFLQRLGKSIVSTDVGKGLINSLPASATTPDMTALWEASLNGICHKETSYQAFMQPLLGTLSTLIQNAGAQLPTALNGLKGQGYRKTAGNKSGYRKSPYRKASSSTKRTGTASTAKTSTTTSSSAKKSSASSGTRSRTRKVAAEV